MSKSERAKANKIRRRIVERTRLQSWETKLWFGDHEGKKLRDVPRDYLLWMTYQMPCKSWRIKHIQNFLRAQRLASCRLPG